ncbi:MAG: DNA translocase FtsK, partial [Chloroflexi bacterium]|nr:DNA translocase FtsK [Chloroflexota bacterium]
APAALVWGAVVLALRALGTQALPPLPRLAAWGALYVLAFVAAGAATSSLAGLPPDHLYALLLQHGGVALASAALATVLSATLALALAYSNARALGLARGAARLCWAALGRGRWALSALAGGLAAATRRAYRALPRLAIAIGRAGARVAAPLRGSAGRPRPPLAEAPDALPTNDYPPLAGSGDEPMPETAPAVRARPAHAPVPHDAAQPAPPLARPGQWQAPPLTLLDLPPENGSAQGSAERVAHVERKIERTLSEFDVPVKVVDVRLGPTVTQFGVEPGYGERRDRKGALVRRERVKVREILARQHDLALALAAPTIRIEAPVPGRPVVGIEVPNQAKAVVSLRALLETDQFRRLRERARLPLALGEHLSKEAIVADLAKMPHLLIAGATGSGKSVCINALLATLVMYHTPDTLRLLLVDPKRVEMTAYQDLPHLLAPVVVDVEKTVSALRLVLQEMDRRYRAFAEAGVRNIDGWNRLSGQHPRLPYIVVIVDELADLMMLAPDEVERAICRLAQLARATGIHLVVATQRPSVDVVTGLIKANIPTRISFMVTSQVDSRTILDMGGAEKLLGSGDMLYMPTDVAKPLRLQGTYVSDDEIQELVQFWTRQGRPQFAPDFANLPTWSPHDDGSEDDDLYEAAIELAQHLADQGKDVSVSYLQRRLRVGYNRAARLKERLLAEGMLGDLPDERQTLELARAGEADERDE